MKSLKRRFEKLKAKNPLWSSYICFAEAIKKQNFGTQVIRRWFHALVEKSDYLKKDKNDMFKHLIKLTKRAEDDKNQG